MLLNVGPKPEPAGSRASVDVEHRAADVGRLLRGEEQYSGGDVARIACHAERDAVTRAARSSSGARSGYASLHSRTSM